VPPARHQDEYEVVFNQRDTKRLLQDNFFLNDNKCRNGLLCALAAVFSSNNVFSRFTEAGQQRDHPRVVLRRLDYFALISTKVRAHLKTLGAAECREALDDDGGGNGDHGRRADADKKHFDGGSGSDAVCDDAVGGNSTIVEPLNGNHRPEWVKELPIVDGVLSPQGAGAINGLRIVEALDAGRTDSVRPSPPPPSARNRPGTSPARPTVTEPVPQRPIGTAPLLPPTAERVGLRRPPLENDSDGDDAWSSPDDEEDPPHKRRRTREGLREAAARRAAARVLTDDIE